MRPQTVSLPTALQVRFSLTDPAVIGSSTPTQGYGVSPWYTWEPILELAPTMTAPDPAYLNTPPSSPTNLTFYVVGPSPTGAWVGQSDKITFWDGNAGRWVFYEPEENSVIHDDLWYDGYEWRTNGTDPQIQIQLTTAGAQTVYFLIQLFDTYGLGSPADPQCVVSWEAA